MIAPWPPLMGRALAAAAPEEPWNSGWSVYIDNDALALVNRDQQYTGGFAVTLSGRRAAEYPWSLDRALSRINRWSGWSSLYEDRYRHWHHSWEVGATAFTPEDISSREPIGDDHPYASVVFAGNTQQIVLPLERVSYQSTLAVGLLGSNIVPELQRELHEVLGDTVARGWDNQISDGGELTFSYVVMRQQTHWLDDAPGTLDYEIKSSVGGSVGYTTQANVGVNWRLGRIETPWYGFNPDYAEYVNMGTPVASSGPGGATSEFFLWGGIQLRYRLYNALLEGQFRDSRVTFDREDDLESLLWEASLGITRSWEPGLSASFLLRARRPELPDADGLDPVWGGLVISRSF